MSDIMEITTLYVSQEYGNDNNQGFSPKTEDNGTGPLKTIDKALKTVSQLRLFGAVQPVTIRILDSVYKLKAPIVIKNNVSAVTVEPENKTLLSGGMEVKGFKKDKFNSIDCFSVDLSDKGELKFSDFYVNGKAAKRTRYPDKGTLEPEDIENHSSALHDGSKWFIAKEEDFKVISADKDNCIISFNHYWIDEHSPVESTDAASRKVELKYKSRCTMDLTRNESALRYIVENTARGFKNPNEWYYDGKKLYYIPENKNEKAEELTGYIPLTDKLVCIIGETDKKVRNIIFRNFDMAYTKGEHIGKVISIEDGKKKTDYYASDGQSVCNGHGSVEFTDAYACAIENCRMYCVGVHAISVNDGCSHIRICNNEITEMGGGGIIMSGGMFGSEINTHTYSNTISNNTILHGGNRYYAACGILIKHSYENVISHNEIGHMYYSGISCGWVWGYKESITHDNIIEKNHIHHLGSGVLSDMGGIYLLGKQLGTVVRNNHIHDVYSAHYGGWALYTDEGSIGITLENNVCHDTSDDIYHQHYGSMNVVRNNIFAFSKREPIAASRPELQTGIIVERNIIICDGTPVVREGYSEDNKGCTQMIVLKNNLIYDACQKEPKALNVGGKKYSFEESKKLFGVDFCSITEDPLFEDMQNRNFTLRENSPAYKIGFKPIDISDVGPCF